MTTKLLSKPFQNVCVYIYILLHQIEMEITLAVYKLYLSSMEKIASVVVEILHSFQIRMLPGTAIFLSSLFLIFLAALAYHLLLSTWKDDVKWPPSPPRLPLLGNLHQMKKGGNLLSTMTDMAKSYGPVMTVWMGPNPLVVLTGKTAIWEALVNQASNFAGRPPLYSRQFTSASYKTIISSPYNERWIKLRKLLHNNVLSPFHVASQSSSHQRSVSNLINKLEKEMEANKGVVRPFHAFKMMAMRFIAPLCFGPDFEDESFLTKLEELIAEDISLSKRGDMLLDSFPPARYFIPSSIRTERNWKSLREHVLDLLLPFIRFARSYRRYLKQNAPNTFLNCLLSIGEGEDEECSIKLSDEEIAFNLHEIFLLAVDSTSTAIEWALAYLITHPHIQDKAYQEISEAVKEEKGGLLRLEDLGKLPYLQAVVKETLRKESIAPLAMIHQTVNECKVMGIRIPAKSQVLFNLHGVSNDPGVWKKPDEFTPERFLDNLDSDKVRMSYLPFGAGRRVCAGMDVASVHVPITLANLLFAFEWGCVKEGSLPDLTRDIPSLLMCMKYPLHARISCRYQPEPNIF